MANTTIAQLTSLTGSTIDDLDLLLVHDTSTNIDKQITHSEYRNGIAAKPFLVPLVVSTSSANAALRITQTGAGQALVVEDSTNPDGTPFTVDTSGNLIVGTGTTYNLAPDGGGSFTPKIQVHATSEALSGISTSTWTNSSTSASHIIMAKSHGTAVGTHSALISGEDVGSIVWNGSDGVQFQPMAAIRGEAAAAANTTSTPGQIIFATTAIGSIIPTDSAYLTSYGNFGLGVTPGPNIRMRIGGNLTTATSAYGFFNAPTVQSDVTLAAYGSYSAIATANTTTVPTIYSNYVTQGTIGTGSTITTQVGYAVSSAFVGATNNYGFQGALTAATGRWNLYMSGNAQNYLAGNLGIGTATPTVPLEVVGGIKGSSYIQGGYTALANGTTAMALGTNTVVKVTPTAAATFTTTVSPAGSRASLIILTSGTTSYTITFGTGFVTTGTLATGTVTGKYFVINFVSDGTSMIEAGRTTAM